MSESMNLHPAETAVMCVLRLRGAQTAGEIRTRTARLFEFTDLARKEAAAGKVQARLQRAGDMEDEPGTRPSTPPRRRSDGHRGRASRNPESHSRAKLSVEGIPNRQGIFGSDCDRRDPGQGLEPRASNHGARSQLHSGSAALPEVLSWRDAVRRPVVNAKSSHALAPPAVGFRRTMRTIIPY